MKTKGKIQAQLSAYLDGELDEAQLRQVEEALENDGDLRVELAQFAATRNLLRDLPTEKPPVDLVSRILAEAERNQLVCGQHGESGSNPLRWVRYVASAAVLLMAATVGMIIAVTLCSPGTYQGDMVRTPAPGRSSHGGEDKIAIASGDGIRGKYVAAPESSSIPIVGSRDSSSGMRAGRSGKTSFDDTGSASVNDNLPGVSGKGGGGNRNSGINNNVDRITAVLAGNLTSNEIIYSDRLDDAQKQVEGILFANGIAPVVTERPEPTAELAKQAPELALARGNFYVANRLSSAQVQYEAYVTPKQMEKVQKELGRLRAKQNVSQHNTVLALAKADGPMKDGGWYFEDRPRNKSGYHYKKRSGDSVDEENDNGRTKGKARDTTVVDGTVSEAARSSIVTAQTVAKREERSPARAPGAAEGELTTALAPVALPRPVRAAVVRPAPAAKPAITPAPTAPEPTPAPPTATEAPMPNESLAAKSKLGESSQVKDDVAGVAGVAKEINGSEMAHRKIAETSSAVPPEKKAPPAVADIDGPDLLSRRQTLEARFGAGTDAPSTRPVGQVAGPVGGQIAAGTPNVRVTPPANQPATPEPAADADNDTRPIVQVTMVDGKTMQAGEKITIELNRKGQAKNNEWSATRRPLETHGPTGARHLAKALPKAEQSPTKQLDASRQSASQSVRSGVSQRGIWGDNYGMQTATRVQRLLITLNYRHVDQANKAFTQTSAKIQANPTSRATTSQIEQAEDTAAQQPAQK